MYLVWSCLILFGFLFVFRQHLHECVKPVYVKWFTQCVHLTHFGWHPAVLFQQVCILIRWSIISPIVSFIDPHASDFVQKSLVPGVFLRVESCANFLIWVVEHSKISFILVYLCSLLCIIDILLCQNILTEKADSSSLSRLESQFEDHASHSVHRNHLLDVLLVHETLLSYLKLL